MDQRTERERRRAAMKAMRETAKALVVAFVFIAAGAGLLFGVEFGLMLMLTPHKTVGALILALTLCAAGFFCVGFAAWSAYRQAGV